MGAFLNSLFSTIGRTGSEAAQGQQQARQNALEEQARQLQMIQSKIALDEINQRMGIQAADEKRKQQKEYRETPEGQRAYLKGMLGRDPTDAEIQRSLGVAPPRVTPDEMKRQDWQDATAAGYKGSYEQWTAEQSALGRSRGTTPKLNVDPIIIAQVGKPPNPANYPKGEADPLFIAANEVWGVKAETIKNRMVGSRGVGYNMSKPGMFITPDGQMVPETWGDAIKKGHTAAAQAFNVLPRETQMNEMLSASGKLRSAINDLQPGDAFSLESTAVLNTASGMLQHGGDPTLFSSILMNEAAKATNERQRAYLTWLAQLGERVLSVRNIMGMGQGAQDIRAAIQSTLPNVNSGSKAFALQRLDAVDNLFNLLYKGIPKSGINVNRDQPGTPPPGSTIIRWNPATGVK
jgi:hypothetical protein